VLRDFFMGDEKIGEE